QDQEDHRQQDRQEPALGIAHDEPEVVVQLVRNQARRARSIVPVSADPVARHRGASLKARYTSSSAGLRTKRSERSCPRSIAHSDSARSVGITCSESILTLPDPSSTSARPFIAGSCSGVATSGNVNVI